MKVCISACKQYLFIPAVILLLAAAMFAVFLVKQDGAGISENRDVFDSNQFLFPEQSKLSLNIDLDILGDTVLSPSAPAFLLKGSVLGALGSIDVEEKKEVEEYLVQEGDTLSSVAIQFNISLNTLLWANNLTSSSGLSLGQKLAILPVTGAMHVVREGDTISGIAEIYQVEQVDITDFNIVGEDNRIFAGDFLIVPDGIKPKNLAKYVHVPLSNSYFICPIASPCRVTQGLHWYNAVDFSNGNCGEPVYAAAGGTVQRTGYTSTGGYYVRIQHLNGVVTYYGHLSKITASAGATVYQGSIIGRVGYSGKTIPTGPAGCHLHFDVRFAQNPFSRFSVGDTLGQ